jgi:ABC-type branched-subunit amino acid transport system ATPase component/ABC-type branched-subunit amino acid transport system permease subunit
MAQRVIAGWRSVVGGPSPEGDHPVEDRGHRPSLPEPLRALSKTTPVRWLANAWISGLVGLGAVILASGLFGWGSYDTFVIESVAIYAIAAYGLDIATGYTGVFSLGAGAAFAVGGYTVAILGMHFGTAVWVSIPCAIVLSGVLGLVMGIPASRLGGIGLALVSVGFVLVAGDLALNWKTLTGGEQGIAAVVPHFGWGTAAAQMSNAAFVILVLCLLFASYVVHARYRSSALGRKSLAVRAEPIGARALGISVAQMQVLGVAAASALGGLAGSLYAFSDQFVAPDITSLNISILFVIMIVFGGVGNRYGPLIGAAVIGAVPIYLSAYPGLDTYLYAGLLLVVVLLRPRGLIGRTGVRVRLPFPAQSSLVPPSGPRAPVERRDLLECDHISISFSSLRALNDVSLRLGPGEVVALVGANGSGKTTLLNVVSGFYPPSGGTVRLHGQDITSKPAQAIARAGIGRTFQTPKVFPDLTSAEHVALGIAMRHVSHPAARDDPLVEICLELLESARVDIRESLAEVRTLSHGQRRFLEIAMAIARHPVLLLLDEPATGLSSEEAALLVRAVDRVAREGVAVLFVEHQLDVVRNVADVVNVMHLGEVLWSGPPDQLADSEAVRDAYLGRLV